MDAHRAMADLVRHGSLWVDVIDSTHLTHPQISIIDHQHPGLSADDDGWSLLSF